MKAKKLVLVCLMCILAVFGTCLTACQKDDHEHSFDIWDYDAAQHWKKCECGKADSVKANHSYGEDGKCECGAKKQTIGHAHILKKVEGREATCTEDGIKEHYVCFNCDNIFSDEEGKTEFNGDVNIPATGHSLQEHPEVAATCTEDGTMAFWKCERCDTYFFDAQGENIVEDTDSLIESASGHDFGINDNDGWETATPSTCTTQGTEERVCKHDNCDEKQSRPLPLDPQKHEYSKTCDQTLTDDEYHYYPSTCACEDVLPKQEAHEFDDYVTCTICNYVREIDFDEICTSGLKFGSDNSVGKDTDFTGGDVIIPSKHNGLDVNFITYYAFKDTNSIKSIVIPKSIEMIAISAFDNSKAPDVEKITVYYGGTKEDWEALKSSGRIPSMGNQQLLEADIYFYSEIAAENSWHWGANYKPTIWAGAKNAAAANTKNTIRPLETFAYLGHPSRTYKF